MNVLFTLCILVVHVIAPADYCFIKCANNLSDIHVICKRLHSCTVPKHCKEYEANKNWRQLMLNIVNDARNGVANGSKKFNYDNTGAKNMHALSYDMELEYLITCYLNQCRRPRLGGCLDSVKFPAHHGTVEFRGADFGQALWNRVIESFDDYTISHTTSNVVLYHHFYHNWCSLYFWEARLVGCASIIVEGFAAVSCTFGPVHISVPGDVPVYRIAKYPGEIASECEEGRNKKYPALCGNIDEVPAGKMWSRLNITNTSSKNEFRSNIFNIIMILMGVRTIFKIC
ncbi:hypothetical protein WA026_019794 [Henosepilachna vigintioctopunctata]|uniref:Uncharacterized protein n=1 Tax=Henosepilachna vigintioctopunctata TaxID=420089 RepID=A0AAW1VIG5_9CUCU